MQIDVSGFIGRLGGTQTAANLFGVTPGAVSQWRQGNRIPQRHYLKARDEAVRLSLPFEEEWFEQRAAE